MNDSDNRTTSYQSGLEGQPRARPAQPRVDPAFAQAAACLRQSARTAGRGLIWLEEKIVYDPADIAGLIRDDQRVHLAVSSLELKRVESAARPEPGVSRGDVG